MLAGVSATALLTLKARADEHQKRRPMFSDPSAVEWLSRIEIPAAFARKYTGWIQLKTAIRAAQIDDIVRACAQSAATPTIVELGCGLSSRRQRLGITARWFDLDLPEVVQLRESLGIGGQGHRHFAMSALDPEWISGLDPVVASETIVIAEGLWYYLPKTEVDALFLELRRRLPGATMIFDVVGLIDFQAAVIHSRALGAPILWAVDPPFEAAMDRFGLEVIAGQEPSAVLHGSIARLGPGLRHLFALGAKIKAFRDGRSGTMVGRLKPL